MCAICSRTRDPSILPNRSSSTQTNDPVCLALEKYLFEHHPYSILHVDFKYYEVYKEGVLDEESLQPANYAG